ncbi:MAG: F0F1 ATP synthase subunit A, partial [Oribacterium sp.]
MQKLAEELLNELKVKTVFTIPIFGGIGISESVVISWAIMALLIAAAFYLGSNLKVRNPGRRQLLSELIVSRLDSFTGEMLGEKGREYRSY